MMEFQEIILQDKSPIAGCQISYGDIVELHIHTMQNLKLIIAEDMKLRIACHAPGQVQLYLDIKNTVHAFDYQLVLKKDSEVKQLILHDSEQLTIQEQYDLQEHSVLHCAFGELNNGVSNHIARYDMNGRFGVLEASYVYMNQGKSNKTNDIKVTHLVGVTTANVENYGVANGDSRLHIDVDSHIKAGASGSITHQTARLLTFEAGVYAKINPMLHIDENDVQASHACSMGVIDEDHLYYLQSRGLTKQRAVQLIVSGYVAPLAEIFASDELKEEISHRILKKAGEYVGN